MKSVSTGLPAAAPDGVSGGVDWASADHVACVVDAAGTVVTRFTVAHTADGLNALVKGLARPRSPRSRSSTATAPWSRRC